MVNLTSLYWFLEGVYDGHHVKNPLTVLHIFGQEGFNAIFHGAGQNHGVIGLEPIPFDNGPATAVNSFRDGMDCDQPPEVRNQCFDVV